MAPEQKIVPAPPLKETNSNILTLQELLGVTLMAHFNPKILSIALFAIIQVSPAFE
jgi:hypothetical protein